MSSDLERLARDKSIRGRQFADVRRLMQVAAGLIKREGGPEHFDSPTKSREAAKVPKPQEPQLQQTLLERTKRAWREGAITPELITAFWREKLSADGAKAGFKFEVPDCDWTEEEIKRPMIDIKGREVPGLMVPVVSGITLPALGRMYPAMQSRTVREDTPVVDSHETRGWVKVYASVEAPNRNTDRAAAEKFASNREYLPGREITYILGSQAKKDFSNEYFDQGPTWSWLSGSGIGGKLVSASFSPRGRLIAHWALDPGIPGRDDGWRFEEVKK